MKNIDTIKPDLESQATVRKKPWFHRLEELFAEFELKRGQYAARCKELNCEPEQITKENWIELIAKAVHESNWQEGLYLNQPRTEELALEAFDDLQSITGPRLAMESLLQAHREKIIALKRQKAPLEVIGAYNLAAAHHKLFAILLDLYYREASLHLAQLLKTRDRALKLTTRLNDENSLADKKEVENILTELERSIQEISNSARPITYPITAEIKTLGEFVTLSQKHIAELIPSVMNVDYLHFLHKLVMMGLLPSSKCGKFRKTAVHITSESQPFPPPSAVDALMSDFCRSFPISSATGQTSRHPVILAAEVSYHFAAIHPYPDGNGRIARLLMNLVLLKSGYPPVYIKADKKGRHRYQYALRRANRGNINPLASLIAMALIHNYERMLVALNPKVRPKS